jgi:aspartyl protease family protein
MAPTLPTACGSLPPGGAACRGSEPARAGLGGAQGGCVSHPGGLQGLRLRAGGAGPAAPAGEGWGHRTFLRIAACGLFIALTACGSLAQAQNVALAGMLGNKALLVVNGAPPKSVAAGESHLDVKVISTSGDQAVLELNGKRHTLRVGDAPVSVGAGGQAAATGRGNRIVLTAGSGGHFMTPGQINGKAAQFLVDTGATSISMTVGDAERLGLDYKSGQRIQLSTANGVVLGWRTSLASVRIGDVEVFNVEAVVASRDMPFMLLGNSFLTRFQMLRENEQMILVRRY